MWRRNIAITLVSIIIFVVLCTLGFDTASKPINSIAVLWPGAILHAVGAVLFGGWGIVATVLTATMASVINGSRPEIVLGFVVPSFLQSLIPAYYYRCLVRKNGWKAEMFQFWPFLVFASLIPNTLGALSGTMILRTSIASDLPFWIPFTRWLIANIPISLVLGYPLLRSLGPTLAEEGFVVTRWWR